LGGERGVHKVRTLEINFEDGRCLMAKKSPWYSKKQMDVYHDNTDCDKCNNIEQENIAYGTGNLPKCSTCKDLD
jgi:hypothetical protein